MSRGMRFSVVAIAVLMVVPAVLLQASAGAQDTILTEAERQDGWFPLFNGTDLSGWEGVGTQPDSFRVADGAIECTGKGHGWLKTEKQFANFVLRIEYKIASGGNSGMFIRSEREGDPAWTGMEIQILDDHGRPPTPNSAGAIYGSVAASKNVSKPAGEWNAVEITCNDERVSVVMNGTKIVDADVNDYPDPVSEHKSLKERPREGFIGMQNYGNNVWFRNIKLKPLPGGPGWKPLFNGVDLTGWEPHNQAKWEVKDGCIRGSGWTGHLYTTEKHKDFEMRASIRVNKAGNSGMYVRVTDKGDRFPNNGFEAQVDNHDPNNPTGSLYGRHRATKLITRDGDWFQMHVKVNGPHIVVDVNGQTVVDVEDDAFPNPGWICLQQHDPTSVIEYKTVEIKTLEDL